MAFSASGPRSSRRKAARARPRAFRRGLRERKKQETRERLAQAAWDLAYARGWEGVTVDEIAEEAEVSRSTFFRYFARKEAVLFTWREPLLEAFEAELGREGAGETGLDAVRRALVAIAREYQRHRADVVRRQAVINASPALVGHEYEIDRVWEDAIARAFRSHEGRGAAARRRARLRAGAVLGVLRVTLRDWMARGGDPDLVRLGHQALDLLETDLGTGRRSGRRER